MLSIGAEPLRNWTNYFNCRFSSLRRGADCWWKISANANKGCFPSLNGSDLEQNTLQYKETFPTSLDYLNELLSYLLTSESEGLNLLCLSYAVNGPSIDMEEQIPDESNKIIYISMSMNEEKYNKQNIIMKYTMFMGNKTMLVLIIK